VAFYSLGCWSAKFTLALDTPTGYRSSDLVQMVRKYCEEMCRHFTLAWNRERRERCKKWSCLHVAKDRLNLSLIDEESRAQKPSLLLRPALFDWFEAARTCGTKFRSRFKPTSKPTPHQIRSILRTFSLFPIGSDSRSCRAIRVSYDSVRGGGSSFPMTSL
jgi:hypothetical protein